MQIYDLKNLSKDGKEYYRIVLNLQNGEYFLVKNSGCTASVEHFLEEKYNLNNYQVSKIFKIFFNNTDNFINFDNIYKKYHKYFKEV